MIQSGDRVKVFRNASIDGGKVTFWVMSAGLHRPHTSYDVRCSPFAAKRRRCTVTTRWANSGLMHCSNKRRLVSAGAVARWGGGDEAANRGGMSAIGFCGERLPWPSTATFWQACANAIWLAGSRLPPISGGFRRLALGRPPPDRSPAYASVALYDPHATQWMTRLWTCPCSACISTAPQSPQM
jgi:hypothetical protein